MVALTGASGFIGRAITARLLDSGYRVRAILRRTSPGIHSLDSRAEVFFANLSHGTELTPALSDCTALIYCAGTVKGVGPEDFHAANVAGVRCAIKAAMAADGKIDMLLISSLAASHPELSPYAASKHAGETLLRASSIHWSILRPPAVYGPGDREMRPLFWLLRHGLIPIIGPLTARFSLLHVDDLAAAVVAWLRHAPSCAGRIFAVDDGHFNGYGWEELAATLHVGRRLRVRPPLKALQWLALVNEFAARHAGYAPMFSCGKLRELCHGDWVCDNAGFSAAAHWQPQTGLAEGVARLFKR